ncbi:hypothetical protein [Caldisericum sp.]|uniref:hypothetical protein n=1 Tax=Caldisericum sp. TaxID=2499687 RepID=UPI003D143CB2
MKKVSILFLYLALPIFAQQRFEIWVESNLIKLSEKIALNLIGEKEIKENRSEMIDKINRTMGLPLGSNYCQAGQYYTYFHAYKILNKEEYNGWPVPRNGLAISTFLNAKKYGKKANKYFGKKNDFIIWKAKNSSFGHIERIYSDLGKGWVETIGFNVSIGDKEGIAFKRRNIIFPLNRIKVILGIVGINEK